jgi:signal transduction histidine kinase/ligand-binding sensor domain-containing protein
MLIAGGLCATVGAERLPIKTYTAADGLTYEVTRRIVADRHGFLWFCTRGALSRFDGYGFRHYAQAEGLNPSVNDLIITRGGEYWIATNGGGVYRLNDRSRAGDRFVQFPVGSTPQTSRVNVLFEDRSGKIWAGTDGGLFHYDPMKADDGFRQRLLGIGPRQIVDGTPTSIDDRLVQIWSFAAAADGSLWIGTKFGLVRRDQDGRVTQRHLRSPSDVVQALLADPNGDLWVGHTDGLFRIDRSGVERRYTRADGLAHNEIRSLYRSASGTLWIGTAGGVSSLEQGRFRTFSGADALVNGVNTFAEDQAGNLWIGSDRGAIRWSPNDLVTYDVTDGLPSDGISAVFSDAIGQLYVVSPNWFISRFDAGHFVAIKPNLPSHVFGSLWRQAHGVLRDHRGEWWIPAPGAIYRFAAVPDLAALARARPITVYTAADGLAGGDVRLTFEDSRGDIWAAEFAPERTPLARWVRSTGRWQRYSDQDGLPSFNAIASFAEDRSGAIWIGLREGGLIRYRDGRFQLFASNGDLPEGTIRTLHVDRAGSLWAGVAGSQGGVLRILDPDSASPRFERVRALETGGVTHRVSFITEDQSGRMYVATDRSLIVLDTATGRTMDYGTTDGLAANGIGSGLADRHGTLWFGTTRGLSYLRPAPLRVSPVPNTLIVGVTVAGAPVPVSELGENAVALLELPANANHVQIDYLGLAPGSGNGLRYQYKLDGDREWNTPTFTRTVTYAKLPPGRYGFSVRAILGDGTPSDRPATFAFIVVPPVWQRWWFQTLGAMALVAAAFAGYRYRVRRLVALERVRTRIASDLHDDLGASLSQIAILSEVAARQLGAERPAVAALGRIADLSRESIDAMGDIVWAIDPQKDRFANLAQHMRRFAEDLVAADGIELTFDADDNAGRNIPLGADVRREVFLVFKEAMKNAVRHSRCQFVRVGLKIVRGRVVLSVIDDGRGFDQRAPDSGHGLHSLRRRAAALNGTLTIESEPGAGTRVILSVPAAAQRR